MFRIIWLAVLVTVALICRGPGVRAEDAVPVDGAPIDFTRQVQPLLAARCYACHGFDAAARQADLRLDDRQAAIDYAAIAPGDPDGSSLIERIESEDADMRMPPPEAGEPLTEQEQSLMRQWIAEGAAYDRHWALEPPRSTPPPLEQIADCGSIQEPIDVYVQARLAQVGLSVSPEAEAQTLIRRVSLDLLGIPPRPDQIAGFVDAYDADADLAYSRLLDRLLADPRVGERMGRWWLDQARYADSHGYSIDAPRSIWLYRDYVVDAFNTDLSFDRFTVEQLAGDLIDDADQRTRIATGFHRNTQINQEGGIDPEQFRIDSVYDRVATTGVVWLGLSLGCAQCHDHKFDPISQREYYAFFDFFNQQDEPELAVYPDGVDAGELEQERKELDRLISDAFNGAREQVRVWEESLDDKSKKKFDRAVREALSTPDDKKSTADKFALLMASDTIGSQAPQVATDLPARFAKLQGQLQTIQETLVLRERAERRQSYVFIKGDFTRPDEPVSAGTPSLLPPLGSAGEGAIPNRLDLARWLVADDNPLTSRVLANRLWQQLFGQGLVETENDFGLQGTPPSHPELLDHMATEWTVHDWSTKWLLRRIVSSHTYRQQSSVIDDRQAEEDPRNVFLSRQNRLRLDAEAVRDVALVASGLMTQQIGGPPVYPPIPDGVMSQGQIQRAWRADEGADRYRRGLYTFRFRATPAPALNVFDAPDGLSSCTRRIRSNTPLQALTLLNDLAFHECAVELSRLVESSGIADAFLRCTGRSASQEELGILRPLSPLDAARVLLNIDETITRE